MKKILFALAVLSVVLVSDASARSLSKNRAEVLSRGEGYYKEIFMDGGTSLTSRKTLPSAPFLGAEMEYFASSKANDAVDSLLQHKIFCGSEEDTNGWLLYPDGAPRYRMIYVNGGRATKHTRTMGVDGKASINKFIQNGGSYVGTCAGAYAACKGSVMGKNDDVRTSKFYWSVWPGYVKATKLSKSQTGINLEKKSPLLRYFDFGGDFHVDSVRHNGGCYAYEGDKVALPKGTEALARYDFVNNRKVQIDGCLAIWSHKANAQSGRTVLCGSHPEGVKSGERLELMASMVLYAMDGNPAPQVKATLESGKVREMNKRTEDNDPAFTRIGDRQYHHFALNVPRKCKRAIISLEGYEGEDNYDLALAVKRGDVAFLGNANAKSQSEGCKKELVVAKPKSGAWYVSVHCKSTVESKVGNLGTEYEGDLSVLNGVPYKISVRYE